MQESFYRREAILIMKTDGFEPIFTRDTRTNIQVIRSVTAVTALHIIKMTATTSGSQASSISRRSVFFTLLT